MTTPTEHDILAKYSTPGLRKTELTRPEKREQLERIGFPKERIPEVLDELYGPELATPA